MHFRFVRASVLLNVGESQQIKKLISNNIRFALPVIVHVLNISFFQLKILSIGFLLFFAPTPLMRWNYFAQSNWEKTQIPIKGENLKTKANSKQKSFKLPIPIRPETIESIKMGGLADCKLIVMQKAQPTELPQWCWHWWQHRCMHLAENRNIMAWNGMNENSFASIRCTFGARVFVCVCDHGHRTYHYLLSSSSSSPSLMLLLFTLKWILFSIVDVLWMHEWHHY